MLVILRGRSSFLASQNRRVAYLLGLFGSDLRFLRCVLPEWPDDLGAMSLDQRTNRTRSAGILEGNDRGTGIQAPQIIRIACHYRLSPLPRKDYYGRIDNIRRVGGPAEFSAGTGKLLVEGNNFHSSLRKNRPKVT